MGGSVREEGEMVMIGGRGGDAEWKRKEKLTGLVSSAERRPHKQIMWVGGVVCRTLLLDGDAHAEEAVAVVSIVWVTGVGSSERGGSQRKCGSWDYCVVCVCDDESDQATRTKPPAKQRTGRKAQPSVKHTQLSNTYRVNCSLD